MKKQRGANTRVPEMPCGLQRGNESLLEGSGGTQDSGSSEHLRKQTLPEDKSFMSSYRPDTISRANSLIFIVPNLIPKHGPESGVW